MSCGVGCTCGSDPVLLWLWCRPVATAPIRLLAWEPPYATGVAQEMAKRQKIRKGLWYARLWEFRDELAPVFTVTSLRQVPPSRPGFLG